MSVSTDVTIHLPTLHPGQVRAWKTFNDDPLRRHLALRCGRRWGKTGLFQTMAADAVLRGERVGWFTPDYKIQSEAFNELAETLHPVKKSSNRVDGVYHAVTGGRIEFWTQDNDRAGRSRRYHKVFCDENAFSKNTFLRLWETAIRPTLWDYNGRAVFGSTPNGNHPDNFFHEICTSPEKASEFVEYHAPTFDNPYVPLQMEMETDVDYLARRAEFYAKEKRDKHPLVYRQEVLAEFVDWAGNAFFNEASLLVDGEPVALPKHSDAVFAVLDTATKTGKHNDGTGVAFYARTSTYAPAKLIVLDWDYQQIEGSLLTTWLPTVFQRLEGFAKQLGARHGSLGVFIEDKDVGQVLVQQCRRNDWPGQAIDSKLTSLGKDERAVSVSGYVHRGEVKVCGVAHHRQTQFKGRTANHFLTQVCGFRVGEPMPNDDLLDCFTYGVALALGDGQGW